MCILSLPKWRHDSRMLPRAGLLIPGPAGRTDLSRQSAEGFTLVEMLAVMGVIILLLGLLLPSLGSLKGSQDVTAAAYNLRGVLETARSYATANHTYVWVGFSEQDYATAGSGVGHLTAAIVYSTDGTKLVDDGIASAQPLPLPTSTQGGVRSVGTLTQIYGVHLTALDPPKPGMAYTSDTLGGRPYQTDIGSTSLAQSLISSDTADSTLRPFTVQGYTFSKTIRYNPRGEVNVDSTYPCTRIIELGLRPTHGNVLDKQSVNLVAIQQAGVSGAVNIYRP